VRYVHCLWFGTLLAACTTSCKELESLVESDVVLEIDGAGKTRVIEGDGPLGGGVTASGSNGDVLIACYNGARCSRWNPSTNEWRQTAEPPESSFNVGSVMAGGSFCVLTRSDTFIKTGVSVDCYDIAGDRWINVPDLSNDESALLGAWKGKLLAQRLNGIYSADTMTGEVTPIGGLPEDPACPGTFAMIGAVGDALFAVTCEEVYELTMPPPHVWSEVASHDPIDFAVAQPHEVAGQLCGFDFVSETVNCVDPTTGAWSRGPALEVPPQTLLRAAFLGNKVYVSNAEGDGFSVHDYDLSTGAWAERLSVEHGMIGSLDAVGDHVDAVASLFNQVDG
jgi:hypothetical protein